MSTAVLKAQGIKQNFGAEPNSIEILHGVDLTAYRGELVAILGTSGSGKSTLLNILGLLAQPRQGSYSLDGISIEKLSSLERADTRLHKVSFVFQSFHLIDYKNVTENIELPLIYQGVPRQQRRERVQAMVERLGLAHRAQASVATLSGGEKQRVAIARAVITEPTLLLCDEPTGALDKQRSAEVMQLLREVTGQEQTTLIVTHDHQVAAACDRSFFIEDGYLEERTLAPAETPRQAEKTNRAATPHTAQRPVAASSTKLPNQADAHAAITPQPQWLRASLTEALQASIKRLRRNLFTVLGVALGIAALVLTVGLSATIAGQLSDAFSVYQAKKVSLNYTGTPALNAQEAQDLLGSSSYQNLNDLNGVEASAAYRVISSGTDISASQAGAVSTAPVIGASATLFEVQEQAVLHGRAFDIGHINRAENLAVLGENLFKTLGVPWTPGLTVLVNGQPVQVIGVVAEQPQLSDHYGALYLPITSTLLGADSETFTVELSVAAGAGQHVGAEAPLALSPNQPGNYSASVPPEPETLKNAVDAQQRLLLIAMSLVTLVIGAVSTMNIFLIGVMERRQEIGLRLAIGTRPRSIIVQLGLETVLTSLMGTFIGIMVSINAIALISLINRWSPIINLQTIALGVGAGLILGVLAGIYPAWKASRIDPIESLS
ncbi:MAG: ATP-binding cassette domain-containing protein [Rothia sp. (in: high G+C Gram-positive bacteria)]|nr:ATP-binding cassette domain-containing protein [Rothia sp. (in: high G+C Gram-positive bacteria)]